MFWLLRHRRPFVVALHIVLIVASNYLAFWLRFEGAIPPVYWGMFLQTLLLLVAVRIAVFVPFRLYEGLWRYTSVGDLLNILGAVASSSIAFFAGVRGVYHLAMYPRSVFLIDALLLVFFVGGVRLARRVHREYRFPQRGRRVLIFGAGDAGEMIVRDMKNNPFYDYRPIGFVDDDRLKVGRRIHGVPVLGTRADLARIIAERAPDEVLVAIPRAEPQVIRGVVSSLEGLKLPIKTLPNLRDILAGKISVSSIRSLAAEDLLAREPVGLEPERVRALIEHRRVLVTGAGGSIGSELCRQIAGLGPGLLVILDQYENGLFAIGNELHSRYPDLDVQSVIASVADATRIDEVMAAHRPQLVFHAAAHKHVPLMELNRCEAIKNNVIGTRVVAQAALRHEAKEFLLISTDKAVNPTNVMGASKRVAELVIEGLSQNGRTQYVAVRFGNVLNSNGSVVPIFLEQIRAGGPVRVTHPEIKRYFMLIPEAVLLVLHAASIGETGSVYTLEMGEQIPIVEMARNLIRLSGFVPDRDIPIEFIGLRPGEKLYEEIVAEDESITPSAVPSVFRIMPKYRRDRATVEREIAALEAAALAGDEAAVIAGLGRLVPTFTPLDGAQHVQHGALAVNAASSRPS